MDAVANGWCLHAQAVFSGLSCQIMAADSHLTEGSISFPVAKDSPLLSAVAFQPRLRRLELLHSQLSKPDVHIKWLQVTVARLWSL